MGEIKVSNKSRFGLDDPGSRRTALAIGAAVCVVIVLIASRRGPSATIAPPATSATTVAQPSEVAASPVVVIVHVAGEVATPGLYTLPAGSRVAEAIEAAGGPTRKADLDLLNLAEVIVDGTRIEVLPRGATVTMPIASPGSAPGAPISLNSADQAALETVPGIGPVRALAIISYRDEHGGFDSIEELLEVPGIGPVTFASIRDLVVP